MSFLKKKSQVNKVSARDCTPLAETLLATPERVNESTRLKCMKLLVKVWYLINGIIRMFSEQTLMWKGVPFSCICVGCNDLYAILYHMFTQAGADLNSRHPQTPLVIATLRGLTECVENLLKARADANIPANDVSFYS